MAKNWLLAALAAISTGIGVALSAVLKLYNVPVGLALFISLLVAASFSQLAFDLARGVLKKFAFGRAVLDVQSVFDGKWIEDFGTANPDRPYSIIRLHYDLERRAYTANGVPYTVDGVAKGQFHSNIMSLSVCGTKIESRYDGVVVMPDGAIRQPAGHGTFVFSSPDWKCESGEGHIFNRGEEHGELLFTLVRISKFWLNSYGLNEHSDNQAVIQAYHKEKQRRASTNATTA